MITSKITSKITASTITVIVPPVVETKKLNRFFIYTFPSFLFLLI